MSTLSIDLPEPLDAFVQAQVGAGDYRDAADVVQAGLRLLKSQTEAAAAKLERLRAAIPVGLDELERGEGIEVTDIAAWLDELGAEVEAEFQ
jgi:putative addiction module CopG family antidote